MPWLAAIITSTAGRYWPVRRLVRRVAVSGQPGGNFGGPGMNQAPGWL